MKIPVKTFSKRFSGITESISTTVRIIKPYPVLKGDLIETPKQVEIEALWDTGANFSAITEQIARKLELLSTEYATVYTSNGNRLSNLYDINVELPNQIRFPFLTVNSTPFLDGTHDMLIGLDIIGLGDFAITNHLGNTVMSFRIPSLQEIHFSDKILT